MTHRYRVNAALLTGLALPVACGGRTDTLSFGSGGAGGTAAASVGGAGGSMAGTSGSGGGPAGAGGSGPSGAGGTFGGAGGVFPGCTSAPDCDACVECFDFCVCSVGQPEQCEKACGSGGVGGAGGVGGTFGGAGGTFGGAGGFPACSSFPDCSQCTTCFDICVCNGADAQVCLQGCGSGGVGGTGGVDCMNIDAELFSVADAGKACNRDFECSTVYGECTSAVEHCSGVVYVGSSFDYATWDKLLNEWYSFCNFGCGVCDQPSPPPVCLGGRCGPGR